MFHKHLYSIIHFNISVAMEERATERARMKKERDDAKKRVEEEKLVI